MKLKKLFSKLLKPLIIITTSASLIVITALISTDAKNDFKGAKRFINGFQTLGSKNKANNLKSIRFKSVDLHVLNNIKSSSFLQNTLEDSFKIYPVSGKKTPNSKIKSLNRHRVKSSALLWNIYNLKITNKVIDRNLDSVFNGVYSFNKFSWNWKLSKLQAKQFLKTYLGTYLIVSLFSSYDFSNWYYEQTQNGIKFDESVPTFLNKDVLNYIQTNEQQKVLLKQLFGNLNNWYSNLEKQSNNSVEFSLNVESAKEELTIANGKSFDNLILSNAIQISENKLRNFESNPRIMNFNNQIVSNRLLEKASRIQRNGDNILAIIPTSLFRTIVSPNNQPFQLQPLSKTFLGWDDKLKKNVEVNTIFEASQYDLNPEIKLKEVSPRTLRNYLVTDQTIVKNYIKKYLVLGNQYQYDDPTIQNIVKHIQNKSLENVLFNNRSVYFQPDFKNEARNLNYYFALTDKEDFLFLIATTDSKHQFFADENGDSNSVLNYFNLRLNDQNYVILRNLLKNQKDKILI